MLRCCPLLSSVNLTPHAQTYTDYIIIRFSHRTTTHSCTSKVVVWRSGGALVSINKVNLRRVRLVLGWVTMSVFNSWCGTFISVCNQPPRPTQPGHPFVGRCNQPNGSDALHLGSKGRYGSCVCGR